MEILISLVEMFSIELYTTKPFDLRHLFEKVAHFIKTFDKFCQVIRLNCEEHLLLRQPLSRAH